MGLSFSQMSYLMRIPGIHTHAHSQINIIFIHICENTSGVVKIIAVCVVWGGGWLKNSPALSAGLWMSMSDGGIGKPAVAQAHIHTHTSPTASM